VYRYRRYLDALSALLYWSRDVATLTLAIAQVIFGAILIFSLFYARHVHSLTPTGRVFEVFAFVTCLRIVLRP
jgi:hypothetical protein